MEKIERDFCETCGLLTPHGKDDCFEELVRKKKIGDVMFDKALKLLVKLGDPFDPKNKYPELEKEVVALDVETWRWAV